jgi:uncharacterized protein YlxW (UPF0749 family)
MAEAGSPAQSGTSGPARQVWVRVGIALLFGLLGFALVAQLRTADDDPLAGARETDLVRILGDLDAQGEQLRAEIADLEAAQRELQAGGADAAALEQAQRRTDLLGILAGAVPATGAGVEVTIDGPAITGVTLLDTVQELRDAGAEVIEVGGVRIVATSSFTSGPDGGLIVDGQRIDTPVLIQAIGEAATMEAALRIPGGLVDTVVTDGGQVVIDARDTVRIDSVVTVTDPEFAEPQTP